MSEGKRIEIGHVVVNTVTGVAGRVRGLRPDFDAVEVEVGRDGEQWAWMLRNVMLATEWQALEDSKRKSRDCKHGSLARSCEICSLEDQLATARKALRYITGEDVAGTEGHLRPADVASAALGEMDREDASRLGKLGGGGE